MKIVIAPDTFKEALSAKQASEAIAAGVREACPDAQIVTVPMADGGEGTMERLVEAGKGGYKLTTVSGPLGGSVLARYGLIDNKKTVVIEMAQASGLHLVLPDQRNPMRTSTKGTGELIHDALDQNPEKIILCVGGSSTVDGGCGMAAALGVSLLDFENETAGLCGAEVGKVIQIDLDGLDPRLKKAEVIVATDVTNPLLGEQGAARVYGPQKGATPEQVEDLEENLELLAGLLEMACGKPLRDLPGAGAAGGLAMGAVGFLGGRIESGFDRVAQAVGLEDAIRGAALVITGEGILDRQSLQGKVVSGVGKIAKDLGVHAVAFAGRIELDSEGLSECGIEDIVQVTPADASAAEALAACADNLTRSAREWVAKWKN